MIGGFFIAFDVGHGHGGAEAHNLARELADVDDIGAADDIFQLENAPFDEALLLACRMVLGVFRQIAMLARFGDLLNHGRPVGELQLTELVFQRGETL